MLLSQRISQVGIFMQASASVIAGSLLLHEGIPAATPQLDNIYRCMAGIYIACGIIAVWTAITIQKQNTLIFLIALSGIMAGVGRMVSIVTVGIPQPAILWISFMLSEFIVPAVIIISQLITLHVKRRA